MIKIYLIIMVIIFVNVLLSNKANKPERSNVK